MKNEQQRRAALVYHAKPNPGKTKVVPTKNYNTHQLIDKQIAAVINFPKKQIGDLISDVLVLGFPDDNNEPILFSPDKKLVDGGQLY